MNKHALVPRAKDADCSSAAGDAHRYWAFLSYSHVDAAAAERLHRQLEIFRVPKPLVGAPHPLGTIPKRLIPIFRDRQELAASSDLGREISVALRQSRYLIVLCSPAAARSRWVDQEVRDFKRLHGEERVLAAIVGGQPFAHNEDDECFPLSLRQKVDRRGKLTGRPAEPIAADLQDSGDGWNDGMLKLVAGMLDVGLDDLVQREQSRRQKRMTAIVAASLAGMAFTSGLSVVAINARDAARDERREAEGMVSFMLGDLKDELEPIGRLDALDQVGARALAYYERQDKKKLTDEQLAQRSKALTLLGQIATARTNTADALKRYREAMRGTAELAIRYPDDPKVLFDHAQNVFYVGDIARQRGDLEEAERSYLEYQRLAKAMVAIDPNNPEWQAEAIYADENLGIVRHGQRRFNEAVALFADSTRRMRQLASAHPENAAYTSELSNLYGWLADARRDIGEYAAAVEARETQIADLNRSIESSPTNVQLRARRVPALQALGLLQAHSGRVGRAVGNLRRAIADGEALIAIEPNNGEWRSALAAARIDLAATMLDGGQIAAASAELDLACNDVDRLIPRAPTIVYLQSIKTTCLANQARVASARGNHPEALEKARTGLNVARSIASVDPNRDRYTIAAVSRVLGDALDRSGDRASARKVWEAGYRQLPNVAERPFETEIRAVLAERLGDRRLARQLRRNVANARQ